MDDERLLSAIRRHLDGSPDAMQEILAAYEARLRRAVSRRLGRHLRNRLETEDIVQSTLALAVRDLPRAQFSGERPFLAWLLKIADHKLKMAGRYHGAALRDVRREGATVSASDAPQDAGPSPSSAAAGAEQRERLSAALAGLPPEQRRLVELRVFGGLSFRAIAEQMGEGATEGAVRQRYLVILNRLGGTLGADRTGTT